MGYIENNDIEQSRSPNGPVFFTKEDDDLVSADINTISDLSDYNYISLQLYQYVTSQHVDIFTDFSKVNIYYGESFDYYITFDSIKLTMQELNVNWNSLIYTGVNTFYELNETEKLFDTDGIKSDYFTGNKYKVIHNNFDSDFFKEVENNENEGE